MTNRQNATRISKQTRPPHKPMVSVRGEVYDQLAKLARERGVTVASIVEAATATVG